MGRSEQSSRCRCCRCTCCRVQQTPAQALKVGCYASVSWHMRMLSLGCSAHTASPLCTQIVLRWGFVGWCQVEGMHSSLCMCLLLLACRAVLTGMLTCQLRRCRPLLSQLLSWQHRPPAHAAEAGAQQQLHPHPAGAGAGAEGRDVPRARQQRRRQLKVKQRRWMLMRRGHQQQHTSRQAACHRQLSTR